MLTAFVLLMPAAVVMARHKWLFGDKEVRACNPYHMCVRAYVCVSPQLLLRWVKGSWDPTGCMLTVTSSGRCICGGTNADSTPLWQHVAQKMIHRVTVPTEHLHTACCRPAPKVVV